jgi:hypothetical protein
MNKYTVKFFAKCPANGVRVEYSLLVITDKTIKVELLLESVNQYDGWFHEDIADNLVVQFGGTHYLEAFHHGVFIETIRVSPNTQKDSVE